MGSRRWLGPVKGQGLEEDLTHGKVYHINDAGVFCDDTGSTRHANQHEWDSVAELPEEQSNKYKHTIQGDGEYTTDVDVYDVLRAWNITDPAHAHGLKKILQPGSRGAKDLEQDLEEGIKSLQMYLQYVKQDVAGN